MSEIPVLYELDTKTGEANGIVHPFCSNECRTRFRDEMRTYQYDAGVNYPFDWAENTGCDECSEPIHPLHQYEVSLVNTFEATSPEDAVRQMIEWLSDAQSAGYRVNDEDGFVGFYDGDDV